MKILILGAGGREHALAWKLKQSPKVKSIFVAPGNAGTAQIAQNIEISELDKIIDWLKSNPVDLVIVVPDNYLAEGAVDEIQKLGIKAFGPTKFASEIEWSKSFAKHFMVEENIPTAKYKAFTNYELAKEYVQQEKYPLVIKASGLAFGKGVVIAENLQSAENTLKEIMSDKIFGDAGAEVVIEEYLEGDEISIHAFCDGEAAKLFPASQDHKRIFNNDKGPNTGGMGTIAPVPWVTTQQMDQIKEQIVLPTLKGLQKRGREFKGILFPGIMITDSGPKVIEFNARFGDPETQSYMRLLQTDLEDILLACINKRLEEQDIVWSDQSACCVVCASGGYPGEYEKGDEIDNLNSKFPDIEIFHAGTKNNNGKIITNGGRVLGVTATGEDLQQSLDKAYGSINQIKFKGKQYRSDIGQKSLRKSH